MAYVLLQFHPADQILEDHLRNVLRMAAGSFARSPEVPTRVPLGPTSLRDVKIGFRDGVASGT